MMSFEDLFKWPFHKKNNLVKSLKSVGLWQKKWGTLNVKANRWINYVIREWINQPMKDGMSNRRTNEWMTKSINAVT